MMLTRSNPRSMIIAMLLMIIMTTSSVLSGCAQAGTQTKPATGTTNSAAKSEVKAEVKSQSPATIGDAAKNGAALALPANALGENATVTVSTLAEAESKQMQTPDFQILGVPVQVKVGQKETVRLNQPAVITVAIPAGTSVSNADDVYAAYHNGKTWEYFLPDAVDMQKGAVRFTTYHFSVFGVGKLSEKEQINRFTNQMAVSSWAKKANEQAFVEATSGHFDEAFTKMGISSSQAKGKLLRSIVKEHDFGELMVSIESGDTEAFGTKIAAMAGAAVLSKMQLDPDFAGNAVGITANAARAAGLLSGGDYVGAQKEIASAMMDFFPATKALKTAVEVIDTGIDEWKDNEIEIAYQAFKNGAVKYRGYDVTKGKWDELVGQMKGILPRLHTDAVEAYCERNGIKESSLSASTREQIKRDAEAKLRARFEKRVAAEAEIDRQKANHSKIIAAFKHMGLLNRGSFGFDTDRNVTIEDRLYRLYNVMDNIQEIADGEVPIDDICTLIGAWYNDKTPGKSAFYAKLKQMGYPKTAAKASPAPATAQKPATAAATPAPAAPATATYAWVLKSTVDYDGRAAALEASKGPVYGYVATYSPGSFSIKTTYKGKTDTYYKPPVVSGESLTVRAQWSKPPQIIRKDETVSLTLSLGVTANTQSFYTWSGTAGAFFDVDTIAPGSATRGAISLVNAAKQYNFETKKGNNYKTFNETVSAKPRSGSKPGDKMALLVTLYSSFSMGTKYVYEWAQVK